MRLELERLSKNASSKKSRRAPSLDIPEPQEPEKDEESVNPSPFLCPFLPPLVAFGRVLWPQT